MVVAQRHVVHRIHPRPVVGHEDKQRVRKPGPLARRLHEVAYRPVGVFHYGLFAVCVTALQVDVFRDDVGTVVAAGQRADEEWALCGGAVKVFHHMVEHHVVRYAPGVDNLARGIA